MMTRSIDGGFGWCDLVGATGADTVVPRMAGRAVAPIDGPLIVFDQHRVVAACTIAREAGVRTGDRKRVALRTCPNATVVPRDYVAEVQSFERVVSAVADIIPLVELLEPGSLCLDMRGPTRYFEGEQFVIDHVRSVVATQLGKKSRSALGSQMVERHLR